jgi:hypothetical protein
VQFFELRDRATRLAREYEKPEDEDDGSRKNESWRLAILRDWGDLRLPDGCGIVYSAQPMAIPTKYRVFSPDHEVQHFFLLSMKNAISRGNSEEFADLFAKAGLLEKQPMDWVRAQTMLDICNQMEERGGTQLDFIATGRQITMDANFPPEFMGLPIAQKLMIVGEGYPNYNRGTDIGHSKSELIDPQHLVFHLRTPWPDDMSYGVFLAICERFLPPEYSFEVYYDEERPQLEQGGHERLIHVKWELKKTE